MPHSLRAAAVQPLQQQQQQLQPQLQRQRQQQQQQSQRQLLLAYQVRCRFLLSSSSHYMAESQFSAALPHCYSGGGVEQEEPKREGVARPSSIRICFRCSFERSIDCERVLQPNISKSWPKSIPRTGRRREREGECSIHMHTGTHTQLLPTYLHWFEFHWRRFHNRLRCFPLFNLIFYTLAECILILARGLQCPSSTVCKYVCMYDINRGVVQRKLVPQFSSIFDEWMSKQSSWNKVIHVPRLELL